MPMIEPLVQSTCGITLIGAAPVAGATLAHALARAPRLIAADGGADRAVALGHVPDLVIGDLDSISDGLRNRLLLALVSEQESTDFEKALSRIAARFILAVGFLGGRVDHSLAALSALTKACVPTVLLGEEDVVFLSPLALDLALPVGTRLSLFPMAGVTGTSEGLRWPIAGLRMAPDGRIGTSNAVSRRQVRLRFDSRAMLVILPVDHLDAVLDAISSSGR